MSFSASTVLEHDVSFGETQAALVAQLPEDLVERERAELAIAQALLAAPPLAQLVARPEDQVRLTVIGHFNENLEPREDWSPCVISVAVQQVLPPVVEAPAAEGESDAPADAEV